MIAHKRTYYAWQSMKNRCRRKGRKDYKHYGGRGISVCERWNNSYAHFLEDMGECPDGMSLDRKDNDGNYEPANCRWVTQAYQIANRRITKKITFNGQTKTATEWAKEIGMNAKTILNRLRSGRSPAECLNPKHMASFTYWDRSGDRWLTK